MAGPNDPQQQAAPSDSVMLQAFTGLKNVVSQDRLGPTDLARAQNIDLDDAGQPRRRNGFALKNNANFHSLFSAPPGVPEICVGVRNGILVQIKPDYSFTALDYSIGVDPVAYTLVGRDLYYSSESANGVVNIDTLTRSNWGGADRWQSPVVNPTANLAPILGRQLTKPPFATALTNHNGRIILAQDTLLWATQLYTYHYVDRIAGFVQFEDEITGVAALTSGIYVGTKTGVYFMTGTWGKMRRDRIINHGGVIPGSMVHVPASMVKQQLEQSNREKIAVMFMTATGLCVGFDGGAVYNLTQTAFEFPSAVGAAALLRQADGMTTYVGVLDSGGDPGSGARFGDYADAEIRRFGARS